MLDFKPPGTAAERRRLAAQKAFDTLDSLKWIAAEEVDG
jgi:hypothetical protein